MSAPQAILRVRDLRVATRFYAETLGFAVEWLNQAAGTAGVKGPGGVVLILALKHAVTDAWPGIKEPGPGAWVYLYRPNVPAAAAELQSRNLQVQGPIEPYPGYRHCLVTDPDRFVVVFWEPLELEDSLIVEIYRTGPERLRESLAGLSTADLELPWAPGKWTIRQIAHHVVDSDLATFHTLRLALAEPGRRIHADLWDPDNWAAGLRYAVRPVEPALALLQGARSWILDVMSHVPDALEHSVEWPSGYRADVRQLLKQIGGHALHHIAQIRSTREYHKH